MAWFSDAITREREFISRPESPEADKRKSEGQRYWPVLRMSGGVGGGGACHRASRPRLILVSPGEADPVTMDKEHKVGPNILVPLKRQTRSPR